MLPSAFSLPFHHPRYNGTCRDFPVPWMNKVNSYPALFSLGSDPVYWILIATQCNSTLGRTLSPSLEIRKLEVEEKWSCFCKITQTLRAAPGTDTVWNSILEHSATQGPDPGKRGPEDRQLSINNQVIHSVLTCFSNSSVCRHCIHTGEQADRLLPSRSF